MEGGQADEGVILSHRDFEKGEKARFWVDHVPKGHALFSRAKVI